MKLYNVNYNIPSKHENKYIVISDIHSNYDLRIAEYIKELEGEFVIIAGDLLNGNQWDNKLKVEEVQKFISAIAQKHKIIVSMGNHDVMALTETGLSNFKRLESIKNVYPLYNDSIVLNNDRFTNILPNSQKYFSYLRQHKQEMVDALCEFYSMGNVSRDSSYNEHLVAHNPYHFNHYEVLNIVADYDMIETGHFHDGWVPTAILDKNYSKFINKGVKECLKNTLGFDSRSLSVYPRRDLSRGITYLYDGKYYVLLPNNEVYCYLEDSNIFVPCTSQNIIETLSDKKTPALVISGAINTFKKIPVFYPYVTQVETNTQNNIDAKANIRQLTR